jgi:flagellar hook-basal body complex protein FliE
MALLAEERTNTAKWKGLSRQNEKKYEDVSKERDDLKASQMTDAEKAIEAARTEGRNSALSEVGTDLVSAEMALQAATAGVNLPDAKYLNISQFLGDDGRPNKDAIKSFVGELPKAKEEFPDLQGAGRQTGGAPQIDSMDPNELADLIADGSFI